MASIGIAAALMLTACEKKPAAPAAADAKPRATVTLRDGSKVSGSVTSSTPTELTLAGDDGITRTIPTDKVQAVEYAQSAPAAPGAPGAPAAPAPDAGVQTAKSRELIPSKPPASIPSAPPAAAAPAPTAPPPRELVLPVGTEIAVRAGETIDSSKAAEGQTYAADVARGVADASGDVVIPKGSDAKIVIRSASKGGKIRGASDLVLDLHSVRIHGRSYLVGTADLQQKGRQGVGANKRTAEFAGGGAAVGAIIGAIAGGGKGAAIGAGAGAGAGTLTQIITKGTIKVPVETVLTFKLDRPLRVVAE
jgi:hypothetical protein